MTSGVALFSSAFWWPFPCHCVFTLPTPTHPPPHFPSDRRAAKKEPVLLKDQYVTEVLNVMNQKHSVTFRDQAELHQATQFLHDNGVLLHYDDISLKVSSY